MRDFLRVQSYDLKQQSKEISQYQKYILTIAISIKVFRQLPLMLKPQNLNKNNKKQGAFSSTYNSSRQIDKQQKNFKFNSQGAYGLEKYTQHQMARNYPSSSTLPNKLNSGNSNKCNQTFEQNFFTNASCESDNECQEQVQKLFEGLPNFQKQSTNYTPLEFKWKCKTTQISSTQKSNGKENIQLLNNKAHENSIQPLRKSESGCKVSKNKKALKNPSQAEIIAKQFESSEQIDSLKTENKRLKGLLHKSKIYQKELIEKNDHLSECIKQIEGQLQKTQEIVGNIEGQYRCKVEKAQEQKKTYENSIKQLIYWLIGVFDKLDKCMHQNSQKSKVSADFAIQYHEKVKQELGLGFQHVEQYVDSLGVRKQLQKMLNLPNQGQSQIGVSQSSPVPLGSKEISSDQKKQAADYFNLLLKEASQDQRLKIEPKNLSSIFTEDQPLTDNAVLSSEKDKAKLNPVRQPLSVITVERQNLLDTFNVNQEQSAEAAHSQSAAKAGSADKFDLISRKLFQDESMCSLETPKLSQYEFHEKDNQHCLYQNEDHAQLEISEFPLQMKNSANQAFLEVKTESVKQQNNRKQLFRQSHFEENSTVKQKLSSSPNRTDQQLQFQPNTMHIAKKCCQSQKGNYLQIQEGDSVRLLRLVREGIWVCEIEDRMGFVSSEVFK